MKHRAPIRGELGIRTIFNLLGPISNPGGVKRQVVGVFSWHWVEPIAQVLNNLGAKHVGPPTVMTVSNESPPTGATDVAELKDGKVTVFEATPADAGLAPPNSPTSRAATSTPMRRLFARFWRQEDAAQKYRRPQCRRRGRGRRQGRQYSGCAQPAQCSIEFRCGEAGARQVDCDYERTWLAPACRTANRSPPPVKLFRNRSSRPSRCGCLGRRRPNHRGNGPALDRGIARQPRSRLLDRGRLSRRHHRGPRRSTGSCVTSHGQSAIDVLVLAIFIVSSLLCAVASSVGALTICRILQGLGGGGR